MPNNVRHKANVVFKDWCISEFYETGPRLHFSTLDTVVISNLIIDYMYYPTWKHLLSEVQLPYCTWKIKLSSIWTLPDQNWLGRLRDDSYAIFILTKFLLWASVWCRSCEVWHLNQCCSTAVIHCIPTRAGRRIKNQKWQSSFSWVKV